MLSAALQLRPIFCATDTRTSGTACAAEVTIRSLYAMTDDSATAMRAGRRQGVYCTFEAVERVGLARHHDFKAFVVVVSADLALATCTS